ncbi:hypothetical protein GCM10008904_14220 [Paraclostridium ghonii]|uniref:Uncharacterized protein n=1 Tax=Paraclostridium ghonii TaxID=29358 RepID=A0ABU0N028_9FIRM|nr:hypothetical protein [Paeniclostridium ghonii]MDQ0556460.1 hypothetical protein [Paeniclostridium ghonii]
MILKLCAILLILYCTKNLYDLITMNTFQIEKDIIEKLKYEDLAKKLTKCYKYLFILKYITYMTISIISLRNSNFFILILFITFFVFAGFKILATKIFETISKKVGESN